MKSNQSVDVTEDQLALMDELFSALGTHSTRWCTSGACACMGCVNLKAGEHGITKEQWDVWMESRHPDAVKTHTKTWGTVS